MQTEQRNRLKVPGPQSLSHAILISESSPASDKAVDNFGSIRAGPTRVGFHMATPLRPNNARWPALLGLENDVSNNRPLHVSHIHEAWGVETGDTVGWVFFALGLSPAP